MQPEGAVQARDVRQRLAIRADRRADVVRAVEADALRIAAGSGVPVQEVNRLLNQFEQTQKMMKQMSKGGMQKLMRGMKGMLPGMPH